MALKMEIDSIESVDESLRELYAEKDGKFVLDLEGYEDPKGLKSALEKERQSNKEIKSKLNETVKRFEGIDPDKVKNLLSKLENDEEAKLLADGKINEVVAKRMEKQQAEVNRMIEEAKANTEKAISKSKKFEQRVLDNHIRDAAAKAGLHTHAIEDALYRARTLFTLDEDGNAVQLDDQGHPVLGKDSKTPFNPGEWMEEMKEKAPHWFPAGNSGGGAGGNNGVNAGKKSITRSQFEALSPMDKASAMKSGVTISD